MNNRIAMFNNKKLCELLESLLREGRECEWLEFKKDNSKPEDIGNCLSALSNSSLLCGESYGYLVFGVHDKTLEVVGTKFSFHQKKVGNEELENWLATQLSPRVDFQGFEFSYDGKNVVIIRVEAASDTPVAFRDVEFIRIGSYTKKLKDHPERARKIWQSKDKNIFEERIAVENVEVDDIFKLLNYPKYFDLMNLPLPIERDALVERLEEEKIVKRNPDGTLDITNLGAILFAKDLNAFDRLARKSVRVIVYKGKGRLDTIKEQEWVKGYASGFHALVKYICDQLPMHEEIKDALRREIKTYPEVAIRELVANMMIHQDFDISGTGPMVEIFDGRIEFTNPGKSRVKPLRFIDSSPKSRNEKLAGMMRRMNICEERGTGIDKVISAVEIYHLSAPKFIAEEEYFRAIFYAPKELKEMSREEKIRACYQHCCLKYVLEETMTNQSLRERLKIEKTNYPAASKIISDTIKCELIRPLGPVNGSKRTAQYIPFWA